MDEQETLPDASSVDLSGLDWELAAPCPVARFEAGSALIGGEVWVLGGFISGSLDVTRNIDIYNPTSDTWRAGPALPGAETHFGVALDGGDLLVFGGLDKQAGGATTDKVWRLPAGTTAWTAEPPLPTPRAAMFWGVADGTLHVAGGLASDNANDLAEHLLRPLSGGAWEMGPVLPDARNHGGGAVSDGKFFAVAGRHRWDEDTGQSASVHVYDPTTETWMERAAVPAGRSEIGASTVVTEDGRIIIVGGSTPGVKPSANIYEYTPSDDTWSALQPLPEPRKGAVSVRIGKQLIVTTGSATGTEPSAETWVGCCVE